MSKFPHTYSEWVVVIDDFKKKKNDSEIIEIMHGGTIEWQAGVADRFTRSVIDAVNTRMNAATDKFQLDMGRARGYDGAIIQAILSLRKEFVFLKKAINLPAIPEEYRVKYVEMVVDQANNVQNSLEDSAKKDRSGKLSSIIRNHKVNSL